MAQTTLNGKLVTAELEFSKLGSDKVESPVTFTQHELEPGNIVVSFGPEVSGAIFLFLRALPHCGTKAVSQLVSLR